MRIKPFTALRPTGDVAHLLACVPYDTVDTREARALAENNPRSFLRVVRPELELSDDTDPHDDAVYARAAANFMLFKKEGWFVRDALPCLYVYRQAAPDHEQTGIVACCHVDDYRANVIVKHEKTRKDKEDDRTRHVLTLNANTGPVFLTYRNDAAAGIDEAVAAAKQTVPLYDVTGIDGVRHTMWRVAEPDALLEGLRRLPAAYVADGHHRAAAAARAAAERAAAKANHTGDEEYNWFLAALFPSEQLRILPYNRVVRDLNGLTPEAFLAEAGKRFEVVSGAAPEPAGPCRAAMYLGGAWYGLSWDNAAIEDPVEALDVSVLQDQLLGPVLGIDDPRTNARIAFVGGIRGTRELTRLVDAGDAAVAFSMYPVSVDQMMAVADADRIMPPKSTWFEPKLLSGLLVHELED